jgi:hypothetical protein
LTRTHLLALLRRYVVEDLRFHPISARQFAKYVKAAMSTLTDLMSDNVVGEYTPCVTDIMLKEQASDELKSKEELRRAKLVAALQDDPAVVNSHLPPNLLAASLAEPILWTPEIVAVDGISPETVTEQSCCFAVLFDSNR